MKPRKVIHVLLRLLLGGLYIYAGLVKIVDPASFVKDIDNYRMLPYVLVTLMAAILPWLEVIVGSLIILGIWLQGSTLILIVLNSVFIVAISSAMIRGLDIDCGCFSVGGGTRVGLMRLLEDVAFLAASCWLFIHHLRPSQIGGVVAENASPTAS